MQMPNELLEILLHLTIKLECSWFGTYLKSTEKRLKHAHPTRDHVTQEVRVCDV